MKNLVTALSFGGILSFKDLEYIAGSFDTQTMKPGDEFLSVGQISNKIGFVDTGVLRAYAVGSDFEEVTKYFIREGQFAVELESFYNNKPSISAIQAVTHTRLLSIHRQAWNRLTEEIPKLYILTKNLSEAMLLNKIKDNEFLQFGSAKDKYLEFIHRYPDLALSVPLQHIASYLKITPQSLSRIRREIS